jgi:hypothetical protein
MLRNESCGLYFVPVKFNLRVIFGPKLLDKVAAEDTLDPKLLMVTLMAPRVKSGRYVRDPPVNGFPRQ